MSFIIKRGKYRYFDLFVGLKIQLMQYEENYIKNPLHSLLCIISFSRIDLLSSESVHIPSLSNKLSKFTSVSQTSNSSWKIKNVSL